MEKKMDNEMETVIIMGYIGVILGLYSVILGLCSGYIGAILEIQVYKYYLHWALKCVDIAYVGLFGSLGLGFKGQGLWALELRVVFPFCLTVFVVWVRVEAMCCISSFVRKTHECSAVLAAISLFGGLGFRGVCGSVAVFASWSGRPEGLPE